MEEIEPLSTRLLGDISTALEGAELVLGRLIGGKETELAAVIYFGGSRADKFGLLLMARGIEAAQSRK